MEVNVEVNVNENLGGEYRVAGPDRVGAGDALPATSNRAERSLSLS